VSSTTSAEATMAAGHLVKPVDIDAIEATLKTGSS
jgi:hypothetical protein